MSIATDETEVKKLASTALADASKGLADARADEAGIKKIWADSRVAVITIAAVCLIVGFVLGRISLHI